MILIFSYIVGNIDIITYNIFENEGGIYKIANKFHIKTKSFVISNIIPLRKGMYIKDTSIISDIKTALLSTGLFYSVEILQEISNDTLNLKIITRDVWTIGFYLNVEGSGSEGRFDVGFQDLNFLGLGTYTRLSLTNSSEYNGFESELRSNAIMKQTSLGCYSKLTNLEKDIYIYLYKRGWRNIRDFSYYFWINRDSYLDKVFSVIGLNVGYNLKAPRNEPFIGFRVFRQRFMFVGGYNFSNMKFKFLRNIDNFIKEESFSEGSNIYTAFGYNFLNITTNFSIVKNYFASEVRCEFENNPSYRYIIYSQKIYYKPFNFMTFALFNGFNYMDIKDTSASKGFLVGGVMGIRGLNYYETFSNKIYRFSFELRTYSPEVLKLFAFGPLLFYDFAYYGNKISVYGIGLRLQITRTSMPVMRIDYANNGVISFSAGQAF